MNGPKRENQKNLFPQFNPETSGRGFAGLNSGVALISYYDLDYYLNTLIKNNY